MRKWSKISVGMWNQDSVTFVRGSNWQTRNVYRGWDGPYMKMRMPSAFPMVAGARKKKKKKKKAEPLVAPLSAAFSLNPLSRAHPAKRLPPATAVIYSISWMSAYLRARSYETKVAWASSRVVHARLSLSLSPSPRFRLTDVDEGPSPSLRYREITDFCQGNNTIFFIKYRCDCVGENILYFWVVYIEKLILNNFDNWSKKKIRD